MNDPILSKSILGASPAIYLEEPTLKVKRLHPDAVLPSRATDGSAGYDLTTIESATFSDNHVFSTGIAVQIPENHVGLVFSRSGMGFKQNLRLANSVGVIDCDYTGEVKVKLTHDSGVPNKFRSIKAGERIAQMVIVPFLSLKVEEVAELEATERGEKGYGSTGK